MSLEIEGKIIRKLNVQTGTSQRGEWSKQEFILEYMDGNYATQICMNVWGPEKVKDLEKYNAGERVKVSFNLSSREFNGRWYTDVRAWRIEPVASVKEDYTGDYAPTQAQGAGAGYAPTQAEAASTAHGSPAPSAPEASAEDDLPF